MQQQQIISSWQQAPALPKTVFLLAGATTLLPFMTLPVALLLGIALWVAISTGALAAILRWA